MKSALIDSPATWTAKLRREVEESSFFAFAFAFVVPAMLVEEEDELEEAAMSTEGTLSRGLVAAAKQRRALDMSAAAAGL